MRLNYQNKDGERKNIELTEKPMTIGRSADADVMVLDEKSSRVHCGIRFWDGEFYIKDLKSKNGTFVNDKKIDIHRLETGDQVRIGATVFVFEQSADTQPGARTALEEMQGAIDGGKGYSTILREIVEETDEPPMTPIPRDLVAEEPAEEKEGADTAPDAPAGDDDVLDRPTVPESQRKKAVRRKIVGAKKKAGGAAGAGKPKKIVRIKRPENPPSE